MADNTSTKLPGSPVQDVPGVGPVAIPAPLPSAEELFKSKDPSAELPSAEELFSQPLPYDYPMPEAVITESPAAKRILDKFTSAFDGVYISPSSEKELKQRGELNKYMELMRKVPDPSLRMAMTAAAALDLSLRTVGGLFGAGQQLVQESLESVGLPSNLARDAAALPEAFFGSPHPLGIPKVAKAPYVTAADLNKATDLGIIGPKSEFGHVANEAQFANEAAAMKAQFEAPQYIEPTVPEPVQAKPALPDIHEVARRNNPEVFSKYDPLVDRQNRLRSWVDELRDKRNADLDAAAPHGEELAKIQTRLAEIDSEPGKHGLREKLETRAVELAKERNAFIEEGQKTDSPDMANIRSRLAETTHETYEHAEEVSKAYSAARDEIAARDAPPPEAPPELPGPRTEAAPETGERWSAQTLSDEYPDLSRRERGNVVRTKIDAALRDGDSVTVYDGQPNTIIGRSGDLLIEKNGKTIPLDDVVHPNSQSAVVIKKGPKGDPVFPVHEVKAPEPPKPVQSATILQPDIIADATDKFLRAGRPLEEAKAIAAVVAAYYDTRAARFNDGRTASDMYAEEFPSIEKGTNRTPKAGATPKSFRTGTFNDAKNVLKLYAKADASTALHELGHKFLADMRRDAVDPAASAQIGHDLQTLLKWLGVEDTADIKPRHEEKFSRGFETYMMEGRAPSKELASVFSQFRDWMVKIYKSLRDLNAPVSEPVREVFDRLLAKDPDRQPVVAADRPPASPRTLEQTRRTGASSSRSKKPKVYDEPTDPYADKSEPQTHTLNTGDDVNSIISKIAEENGGFAEARPRMSQAETLSLADAIGMNPRKLSRVKIGQAYSSVELAAAETLLHQSAAEVKESMKKAATGSDKDVLEYAGTRARHRMIQETVAQLESEAGRALGIIRAFRESGKEHASLNEYVEQATGRTLEQLRKEAQIGSQLDTTKISKFIDKRHTPGWGDMLLEARIALALTGIKTHVANIGGNTGALLEALPRTAIEAGVGKIAQMIDPSRERVYPSEVAARLFALREGSIRGAIAAKDALMSEQPIDRNGKIDVKHQQAIPGPAGKVIRGSLRVLSAEDEFFKAHGRVAEIYAQAYRDADKHGLKGEARKAHIENLIEFPTSDMLEAADRNALEMTFNQPLGKTGKMLQLALADHPVFRTLTGALFMKTPTNLLKWVGDRSPLAPLLSKEVRADLKGENGDIKQNRAISKMIVGGIIGTAAYTMASEDLITGNGPTDPKERANWFSRGYRPYSVKIGGEWYSYARLDPFSTFGMMADVYAARHSLSDKDGEKAAALAILAAAKNAFNKTWLSGPADVIQAAFDPGRYGEKFVNRLVATAVVPTAVSHIAEAGDPFLRQTHGMWDSIKMRVPYLRETLQPKRDVIGEKLTRDESFGPNVASPISTSKIVNNPVLTALDEAHYYPGPVSKKLLGVELTEQQYDDYARIAGRLARMKVEDTLKTVSFDKLPEGTRYDILKQTFSAARKEAQGLMLLQNPNIVKEATKNKLLRLSPDEED